MHRLSYRLQRQAHTPTHWRGGTVAEATLFSQRNNVYMKRWRWGLAGQAGKLSGCLAGWLAVAGDEEAQSDLTDDTAPRQSQSQEPRAKSAAQSGDSGERTKTDKSTARPRRNATNTCTSSAQHQRVLFPTPRPRFKLMHALASQAGCGMAWHPPDPPARKSSVVDADAGGRLSAQAKHPTERLDHRRLFVFLPKLRFQGLVEQSALRPCSGRFR
ncbi:hypothetical protein L1887_48424 [Cichorium endivia]|nr:hypothetical protein L1887_48424 [Cichorium endivia]